MQPLIIGVSGKKQSGKSSLCDFLKVWHKVVNLYDLPYTILQGVTGDIELYHWDEDVASGKGLSFETVLSHSRPDISTRTQDAVKVYNFADALKEVCNKVLGLTKGQCYGTDAEKNSLTPYLWDNMCEEIRFAYSKATEQRITGAGLDLATGEDVCDYEIVKVPRSGKMTAREIMQVMGTDIFRRMFSDKVWVNATFNKVKDEGSDIGLIADTRFESELNAILENDGYIIRLNRVVDKTDLHPSETALDNYDFASLGDRCLVLDNDSLEINEKNQLAAEWLERILKTRK